MLRCIYRGFPSAGSCVVYERVCLELQLCSWHMMVMDESCSLPERGTELNWKVLLIPPVTASESSLLEIDLSQGGLCGKKAAVISSWWEGMIRFVLSLFFFFFSLLVSANQISSPLSTQAPCWAVKANLQMCHLLFLSYFPRYPIPFLLVCPPRCFDTKRWVILFHHWSIVSDCI